MLAVCDAFRTAATQEILSLGSSCESVHAGLRLLFAQGTPARGNPCPKIMQGLTISGSRPEECHFLGAEMALDCAGASRGGRGAPRLVFLEDRWYLSPSGTQAQSGRHRPATTRTSGLNFLGGALNLGRPYGLFSRKPFLDLPGGRAPSSVRRALTKTGPFSLSPCRRIGSLSRVRRSAYCARGSLQLEGVHDPTMPRLWRQQPCPCQTPV